METFKTNYDICDILLVDDDIDEHFLVETTLRDIGSNKKLLALNSGEKALKYLASLSKPDFPSLIVSDYHMPLMNGKDVLKQIKSTNRYSNIPVVIHSSEMDWNMKCDLLNLGATACFDKTFDMKALKIFLAALAILFDGKAHS